jgi:hypothetical protein
MPTEQSQVQQYQHLVQQAIGQLQSCSDDKVAATRLLAVAQQLTKHRMTLSQIKIDLWQHSSFCPVITQTELISQLGQHYHWPLKIQQLVLLAGYCAALSPQLPQGAQWPKLQRYPALLAARILADSNTSLQAVLAGCYPTERHIPLWQQQPLSIVLTISDYLSRADDASKALLQRIGVRIALSQSDYELSILRRLIAISVHGCVAVQHSAVLSSLYANSAFQLLSDASPRQIERHLAQSVAMMQPILQLASRVNRQQQKVTDLRLALNLLGQQRLPYLVAHAELHHALLQCQHPLQALFEQFSATFAQALYLLRPEQFTEAAARALALCLCTPLWFHSGSYQTGLLRRTAKGWQSALDTTAFLHASAAETITPLLQHYCMTEWQSAAADWLQSLQRSEALHSRQALVLQLAWHSAAALLGCATDTIPASVLTQAQQQGVLSTGAADWLMQLACSCQCHYPLQLTL